MISNPLLEYNIPPFNAKEDYTFAFSSDSDEQIVANELIIEDNLGVEIYKSRIDSYINSHTLIGETLTNGIRYKAKVKVITASGKESGYSNYQDFICLSPAQIEIYNIDYDNQNSIYNQNFTFKATYKQADGEEVESYRFILYDKNKSLLESYPEVYSSNIEQLVTDLQNGEKYYIRIIAMSHNKLSTSSDYIEFTPHYKKSNLSAVVHPVNKPDDGAILIDSKLVQLNGKLYDCFGDEIPLEEIKFIEDEKINIDGVDYCKLVFDRGFSFLDNNFTLQLWGGGFEELIPFFKIIGDRGFSEFVMYSDKIHILKCNSLKTKRSHYASEVIEEYDKNKIYSIRVISKGGILDIKVEEFID